MKLNETAAYGADGIQKKENKNQNQTTKNEKVAQLAPRCQSATRLEQAALIHSSTPEEKKLSNGSKAAQKR